MGEILGVKMDTVGMGEENEGQMGKDGWIRVIAIRSRDVYVLLHQAKRPKACDEKHYSFPIYMFPI